MPLNAMLDSSIVPAVGVKAHVLVAHFQHDRLFGRVLEVDNATCLAAVLGFEHVLGALRDSLTHRAAAL